MTETTITQLENSQPQDIEISLQIKIARIESKEHYKSDLLKTMDFLDSSALKYKYSIKTIIEKIKEMM